MCSNPYSKETNQAIAISARDNITLVRAHAVYANISADPAQGGCIQTIRTDNGPFSGSLSGNAFAPLGGVEPAGV